MESIVIFIIMLLIGSLFNSGKRKAANEEREQPKPFTTGQKEQDNPIKKLKEMSKDLYKEIQQEFEVEQEKAKRPSQPEHEATVREVMTQVEKRRREAPIPTESVVERRPSRETVRSRVATKQKKERRPIIKEKQVMPTSSDDIMKGIIFSEIIGPPKSKR